MGMYDLLGQVNKISLAEFLQLSDVEALCDLRGRQYFPFRAGPCSAKLFGVSSIRPRTRNMTRARSQVQRSTARQ